LRPGQVDQAEVEAEVRISGNGIELMWVEPGTAASRRLSDTPVERVCITLSLEILAII
jgi:hypothetical protein